MGSPGPDRPALVNGIFKGGGAKGIAYAGALQAMGSHQLWFGSVAGTSAGAITAALIAAGYTGEDVASAVPVLLRSVKRRALQMVLGFSDAIFDSNGLRSELDRLLSVAVDPGEPRTSATFAQLHAASGITLYVVALDLSTSSPVVFSHHSTPNVAVADAVMASSAIPAAFPSVRALFRQGDQLWGQRMVDGGAWANYPRFVFYDESFRHWLETTCGADLAVERDRPTLGFALGGAADAAPLRPSVLTLDRAGCPEYDRGTLQDIPNPLAWTLGAVLTSRIVRPVLAVTAGLITVAVFRSLPGDVQQVWQLAIADRTGLAPALGLIVTAFLTFGSVLLTLAMVVLVLISKPLGDVVIPSARSALAVGTGLAPWYGQHPDDHLIIIPVGELTTTGFRPSDEQISRAIESGFTTTSRFLDTQLPARGPQAPDDVPPPPPAQIENAEVRDAPLLPAAHGVRIADGEASEEPVMALQVTVWAAVGITGCLTYMAISLINGWFVMATILGLGSLFFVPGACWRAADLHQAVSRGGKVNVAMRPARWALAVVLLVAGAGSMTASAYLASGRSQSLRNSHAIVRVTSIVPNAVDTPYRYDVGFEQASSSRLPATGHFQSDETRTLGDSVVIALATQATDGSYFEDAPAPGEFMTSVILAGLGLCLVLAGYWFVRILRRRPALLRLTT